MLKIVDQIVERVVKERMLEVYERCRLLGNDKAIMLLILLLFTTKNTNKTERSSYLKRPRRTTCKSKAIVYTNSPEVF